MNIGKLYFATTMYVSNKVEEPIDYNYNYLKTCFKFYKIALVHQICKNKFVDFETGEEYKPSNLATYSVGDKVIELDFAIPFYRVVTDARRRDSKAEILRKASMVKITQNGDNYNLSYIPIDSVYLSVIDKGIVEISSLIHLIYENHLTINQYQIRKYIKDDSAEPEVYIYMEVTGEKALNKLEKISKDFNISNLSSNPEELEEYKNDVCHQKQKRITY